MKETPDENLTALLDGQLGEPQRSEIFRRLASDAGLRDRFSALAQTRGVLDASFTALLAQAPVARMRAALPARPPPVLTLARARMAASLAIAALLGAALAASILFGGRTAADDWTTAVVDYMQLYTPETFAGLKPDAAQETTLVEKVGARLGVSLAPRDLSTADLAFKTAFVLSYEGAPLGEFVFANAAGAPYLFCVLADAAGPPSLRFEKRQGFAVATWGRGDKRFLLIGPSAEIVRRWAGVLADRV